MNSFASLDQSCLINRRVMPISESHQVKEAATRGCVRNIPTFFLTQLTKLCSGHNTGFGNLNIDKTNENLGVFVKIPIHQAISRCHSSIWFSIQWNSYLNNIFYVKTFLTTHCGLHLPQGLSAPELLRMIQSALHRSF
jgi:hypothetical protein